MLFHFDLATPAGLGPTLDAAELTTVLTATSVRFLGRGSFGESWAYTVAGETKVAKILIDPVITSRQILRETEGLTRVTSPNVVRFVEAQILTLAAPVGNRVTLIFEFVTGGDIARPLQAGQWPTETETAAFAKGVLAGLAALHAREVVHRDIKPENLARRGADWGQPVILDLGLDRLLDASTLTIYPAMVGTAPYMAPEVIEGRAARKGSDLWSLGIVLFLMLTRRHPFLPDPAEVLDRQDMYDRVVAGAPAPPSTVPEPLRTIVGRFLSPASFQRGSAARALAELEAAP
jgi:Serine/threonine protein kinase